MGITKLSGSQPLLNVKIETAKETNTMAATAITLATSKTDVNQSNPATVKVPLIINEEKEKRTNITAEAAHALKICVE